MIPNSLNELNWYIRLKQIKKDNFRKKKDRIETEENAKLKNKSIFDYY